MFVIYIYMNSTTPKRHAETLRNWNISFQLKKWNTYRNKIDNLALYMWDLRMSIHLALAMEMMLKPRFEEIWLLWTVEFVSLLPFFLSILYLLSPITQLLWVQPFCFWTLRGFFPAQDFPYSPCFTLNQMTTNCQVGFWDLTLEIASCLSWSEYLIY